MHYWSVVVCKAEVAAKLLNYVVTQLVFRVTLKLPYYAHLQKQCMLESNGPSAAMQVFVLYFQPTCFKTCKDSIIFVIQSIQ